MSDAPAVRVSSEQSDGGDTLSLAVDGALTTQSLPSTWPQTLDPICRDKPKHVRIDAAKLNYLDGGGLGLLTEVRRQLAEWGGDLELQNLSPELQSLVDMGTLKQADAPQLKAQPVPGVVVATGEATAALFSGLYGIIAFLGQTCAALAWSLRHPRKLRWDDLLTTADKVGTDAVPVICLLGFLIGVILAFQSAPPLERYGVRDTIPTLVSISIIRELGPLIASLLMAGRTGSAFAAELGTMKVTEEISALQAMGFDPVQFLVTPRVLAAMIAAPLLSVFSSLMGVLGGYMVMANYGFSFPRYLVQVKNAVQARDLLSGELKTLVFGLIIGMVGCLRGLRTASGPGAVGDSATKAVVTSIVLIIATDGVFGVVFYYLHW